MGRKGRLAAGFFLGIAVAGCAAPRHACDELAGLPASGNGPGVGSAQFNPDKAIPACLDAVKSSPDSVRFWTSLGRAYQKKKAYPNALFWYRKAAERGDAEAQANLGMMYMEGGSNGVAKDAAQAAFWYRKAADQGHALAKENLERLSSSKD